MLNQALLYLSEKKLWKVLGKGFFIFGEKEREMQSEGSGWGEEAEEEESPPSFSIAAILRGDNKKMSGRRTNSATSDRSSSNVWDLTRER